MFRVLILFFLIISSKTSAQLVEGQILIFGTEEPLPNASIYYDGMYKGTISDEHGIFKLRSTDSVKIPIIISAVGYHSTFIADYKNNEFIKIYLEPKTYSLDAVVITYDGMSREEKEKIFKTEFIGLSQNSQQCEILNLDDIDLVYNKKHRTVEASSDKPIILHNKALGFKITYYLEHFKHGPGTTSFSGNYYFEPDTSLRGKYLNRVERRRREAYLGSRMHFIRSLYHGRIQQEGYTVLDYSAKDRDPIGLVVDDQNSRGIIIKSRLAVIYKGETRTITYLDKKKDFTFIDKNGFYDPAGIMWSGGMANQRIGDLLPFEYVDLQGQKR